LTRKLIVVAAAAAAIVGCLWPAGAIAASPACAPGQVDEAFTTHIAFDSQRFPREVIRAVDATAPVYIGHADDSRDPEDVNVVTVEPAGAEPLSHPYRATYPFVRPGAEAFPDVPLRFEAGDGPAVIRLTLTRQYGYSPTRYCRVTVSSHPITPIDPELKLLRGFPGNRRWSGHNRGVDFRFDTKNCGAETVALEFRVAGVRRPVSVTSRPGCVWGDRPVIAGPAGVKFVTQTDYGVSVSLELKRAVTRKVTYRVRFAGDTVRTGSFRLAMRYHRGRPGRRIYDTDFDNYVNICINEGYEIRAHNGRLYCAIPGTPSYWYATVSRLR
jgi:hypothetical protein